jgi:hypothetical protein
MQTSSGTRHDEDLLRVLFAKAVGPAVVVARLAEVGARLYVSQCFSCFAVIACGVRYGAGGFQRSELFTPASLP